MNRTAITTTIFLSLFQIKEDEMMKVPMDIAKGSKQKVIKKIKKYVKVPELNPDGSIKKFKHNVTNKDGIILFKAGEYKLRHLHNLRDILNHRDEVNAQIVKWYFHHHHVNQSLNL